MARGNDNPISVPSIFVQKTPVMARVAHYPQKSKHGKRYIEKGRPYWYNEAILVKQSCQS